MQVLLNNIKAFYNKYKNVFKYILYTIVGLFLMYWMIYLFTPKPQMPKEYKDTIDNLTKANIELVNKQKEIDNTIAQYQTMIGDLDIRIKNIKEKTTIIREYYHEKSKQVDTYTPTQVDSFFKSRYNY